MMLSTSRAFTDTAMKAVVTSRNMLLLAAVVGWCALCQAETTPDATEEIVSINVTGNILEPDFMGIGFNLILAADPNITLPNTTFFNEVYAKRLREARPGFARLNPAIDYSTRANRSVMAVLKELDSIGTSVYMTTFSPPYINITNNMAGLNEYGDKVAKVLDAYLELAPNAVKFYCWTNELSLCLPWDCNWGSLIREKRFDIWGAYYTAIYQALVRRNSSMLTDGRGLLATDASPVNYWWTIDWALGNVKNETAIYGGHHYPNNYTARDTGFYDFWLGSIGPMSRKTKHAAGKRFVIGETGGPQYTNTHKDQSKNGCDFYDGCAWFDTPDEPYGMLQLVEQAIGALNGGAAALSWWTFFSEHFEPGVHYKRCNDWGASRWNGTDTRPRMHYDALGQVSRAFLGPAAALQVATSDPLVRVGCVGKNASTGNGDGDSAAFRAWSCVVSNRRASATSVAVTLPTILLGAGQRLRSYTSSAADVAENINAFGDLHPPRFERDLAATGTFTDVVPAYSVTVYTTDFRPDVPAPVADVSTHKSADGDDTYVVTWTPNPLHDRVAYYRVFSGCGATAGAAGEQLRSTIDVTATVQMRDCATATVVAVNIWGNHL
eukprot:m.1058478 g.1058478  ORF g.1058478 m.1058478 type:complete len:608 (+) comp24207_c0_seq5:146-1969(+)